MWLNLKIENSSVTLKSPDILQNYFLACALYLSYLETTIRIAIFLHFSMSSILIQVFLITRKTLQQVGLSVTVHCKQTSKNRKIDLSCDTYCTITESTKINNKCMLLYYVFIAKSIEYSDSVHLQSDSVPMYSNNLICMDRVHIRVSWKI